MPSLKAIRKRIGSVKNTQKITRAMKLVAAARLRRAQEAIIAARPYSAALERVVAELAERAGRRAQVVVMTSDRGLAGSFNAQVLRRSELLFGEELGDWDEVGVRVVGRKGNEYYKRRDMEILSHLAAPTSATALSTSGELANLVVDDFLKEKVDRVYLIFSEFKSAMTQKPLVTQLLPIKPRPLAEGEAQRGGDFIYEPSKEELLEHLVPLYIQNGLYRAALESIASELGARMSAMDSATRNAGDMIGRLTLQYNRARQAAITKELLEIIGGAEALKG
ncbi:MAG TPA: ATP synthase F1 subunit gamma [Kofleriaceae bacterium]|nr:ATP synthase F1 subunit gamma [Kofleriaceae bacterium]